MGKFHSIQINDEKLYMDMAEYCRVNKLKLNEFCTGMLKKQFAIELYGDIPFGTMFIPSADKSDSTIKPLDMPPSEVINDEKEFIETIKAEMDKSFLIPKEVFLQKEKSSESEVISEDSEPKQNSETNKPTAVQHNKPLISSKPRKRKL